MSCGEIITSNNNGYVKRFAKLNDSKFRRAEKLFLCEGRKLVLESLMYADVKYLLVLNTCRDNFGDIIALAKNRQAEIIYLSESPFHKISTENSPQGVIAVVNEPKIHRLSVMTGEYSLQTESGIPEISGQLSGQRSFGIQQNHSFRLH